MFMIKIIETDLLKFTLWSSIERGKYLDSLTIGLNFDEESINKAVIAATKESKEQQNNQNAFKDKKSQKRKDHDEKTRKNKEKKSSKG